MFHKLNFAYAIETSILLGTCTGILTVSLNELKEKQMFE